MPNNQILALAGVILSIAALSRSGEKTEVFVNGGDDDDGGDEDEKVLVVTTASNPNVLVRQDLSRVVFDRKDWKPPNFKRKCGVFNLPSSLEEGRRVTFYNNYKQCNILTQTAAVGSAEKQFWHVYLHDIFDSVELEYVNSLYGYAVINRNGHGVMVHSLRSDQQSYLYVLATVRRMPDLPTGARDFLAVVDTFPSSVQYGQLVHIALGYRDAASESEDEVDRTEYHHGSIIEVEGHPWFVAPSLSCSNSAIDFYDLAHSRRSPALTGLVTRQRAQAAGMSAFHTVHQNPRTGEILISFLGDGTCGPASGGLGKIENNLNTHFSNFGEDMSISRFSIFNVTGDNTLGNPADSYGYDWEMEGCLNFAVVTSWAYPEAFDPYFNPEQPYGRSIRVMKFPDEVDKVTREDTVNNRLTLLKSWTLDPVPGMGGPPDGDGVVALEARRSHVPKKQYYLVSVTLPGSVVLIYCDKYDLPNGCSAPGDWFKRSVIPPDTLVADALSLLVTNQQGNNPTWVNPFGFGNFSVPLVTDITVSNDDKMLYVSLWLWGAVLQYDISDWKNPVLVGGMAGIGGVTTIAPFTNVFNPNAYEFSPGQKVAGGSQMLQLDWSGQRLYITTSLFSGWDQEFFGTSGEGSIDEKGGMILAFNTGVVGGIKVGPVTWDTTFGENGVLRLFNLTHPEVDGPFAARAHQAHYDGLEH